MADERLQMALARLEASLNALADSHDQFANGFGMAMLEMKRRLFDLDGETTLPAAPDAG